MTSLPRRRRAAALALLLTAGCLYPVREKVDGVVCDLAARERDPGRGGVTPPLPAPADRPPPDARAGDRLQVPPALLPGGPAPRVELPTDEKDPQYKEKRRAALEKLYPPLPPLGDDPRPAAGPEGRPLTLADLQRLALSNSPLVRQAAANVEAMRGAAVQAGAYPNPTIAFEQDTAGTSGGPGYVGGYVSQLIKTANKLQLQRAAAAEDLRNAELALRRAQADLTHAVRGGYFAVLVAGENLRVSRALAEFTDAVYQIQVENVRKGGFAAPYEPMQLRVLAWQARAALVQARNRHTSAWKQLAASLGLPGMPPTELAGRVDGPVPVYDFAAALTHALQAHTDVLTAGHTLQKARFNLQLAQVTPIPDVTTQVTVQKDHTGPPFNTVYSVQMSIPFPVWDRNQGGIMQAQAAVVQSSDEAHRVRDDLTTRLATAFEAYENNRALLRIYRDQVLPDQVRAYEAVYERYKKEAAPPAPPAVPLSPTPAFSDVVVAQQNLATAATTYVTTLGAMWQAVADVADVLQTDDLFQLGGVDLPVECFGAVPDLAGLPVLPCCHPCSPLPDPALKGAGGDWPPADAHPAPPADRPPEK
jgi:cobalt-zinc-cadmium efflux system outer membrane protein